MSNLYSEINNNIDFSELLVNPDLNDEELDNNEQIIFANIKNYYVSDYDIGIYQAGMRALVAATLGLGVINSVLVPKLSSLSSNKTSLISLSTLVNKSIITFALFIVFVINFFRSLRLGLIARIISEK